MAETLTNTNGALILKQSTPFVRPFYFGTLSQTVAVSLSKNGNAWAAAAGAVAEIGGAGNGKGWYTVSLTTVDTNTSGALSYDATAASGGPVDFCDLVQTTIFTDLALTGGPGALVTAQNVLRQNQALASFPFTMTKSGVPVPGISATITAQRNFGSGWSNMANNGTYSDQGFGVYFIALASADTNGSFVAYRFSSIQADDNVILVGLSP